MSVNYSELFNNIVEAETTRRGENKKKINTIKADMDELKDILHDVTKAGSIEDASVEYIHKDDESTMVFAYGDSELTAQLTTHDDINVVVKEKTVSFKDETVQVQEAEVDVFVVHIEDETLVYDRGADYYTNEELYAYMVERAANLVANS